jgi:SAM-dependent methyltransferase
MNDYYEQEGGRQYHQQRSGARSDHVQSLRSKIFVDFVKSNDIVVDFGCGTGGILARLNAKGKIGIEIGEEAAIIARKSGLEIYKSLDLISTASIDKIISYHALEHVKSPYAILEQAIRVIKPGGSIRVVVPYEHVGLSAHRSYSPNWDNHLYSWTPLTLANLVESAGFSTVNARLALNPTGSRIVRYLEYLSVIQKACHFVLCYSRNAINVVIDAKKEIE